MAKPQRGRKPPGRIDAARARPRFTLLVGEAAEELHMQPRTLRTLLRKEGARCLVKISNRYLLDRKGFLEWCRRQGIESATMGSGGR